MTETEEERIREASPFGSASDRRWVALVEREADKTGEPLDTTAQRLAAYVREYAARYGMTMTMTIMERVFARPA